jgi:eukaryotic-like serine/threonine-protein kinase
MCRAAFSIEEEHTAQLGLKRYQLVECIARGGMGEVWKALDTQLQRYVAIKLLHTRMQQAPDFVARFEQEARLVASLHHPNIVKIHDFKIEHRHRAYAPESDPPLCYMVMDYVQGETLADYIRNTSQCGQFPPAGDIVYIFTVIGLALDYAHQCGMIHRDIKPANILLDQRTPTARSMGEPILTDFGIARQRGVAGSTLIGSVVGTPKYIAPEQAQGHYDDPRSDLYSLGIILYEMTTGTAPFQADAPLAIVMQHLRDDPKPPATINPHISQALSQVILKSIAKDPNARFPSGAALALALAYAFNVSAPEQLGNSGEYRPSEPSPSPAPVTHVPLLPASNGVQTSSIELPLGQQPPMNGIRWSGWAKRPWVIVLVALLVLALLGSTLAARVLLSPNDASETNQIVGHMSFVKSGASQGYNAIQIDIAQVSALPPGMAYYGWIRLQNSTQSENTIPPHWKLAVSQQAIHTPPLTFAGFNNLYVPQSLFLITKESTDSTPIIPNLDPTARLYYAIVMASPATNLDIKACPTSETYSICASF